MNGNNTITVMGLKVLDLNYCPRCGAQDIRDLEVNREASSVYCHECGRTFYVLEQEV